jgi:hypothetical protein
MQIVKNSEKVLLWLYRENVSIADTDTLVKKWLLKHPEKKAKTNEEIEVLRNRMAGIRRGLTTEKKDQSAEEIGTKDTNPSRVLEPNSPGQYESAIQTIRT